MAPLWQRQRPDFPFNKEHPRSPHTPPNFFADNPEKDAEPEPEPETEPNPFGDAPADLYDDIDNDLEEM